VSQIINWFSSPLTVEQNKLECLSLEFISGLSNICKSKAIAYPIEVPQVTTLSLALSVNVSLA
jgi:hypothetical protein